MNMISDSVDMAHADIQVLAISSVPMQKSNFKDLYSSDDALLKGTVFPELYLPFGKEGSGK
jgi:hypothetical protein